MLHFPMTYALSSGTLKIHKDLYRTRALPECGELSGSRALDQARSDPQRRWNRLIIKLSAYSKYTLIEDNYGGLAFLASFEKIFLL